MKKFVGLTMAAVCALTVCAFGFSGCEKASDVVTEEEWIAAMASENALNVTLKGTYSYNSTETENGVTETVENSGSAEFKTALTKIDAESSDINGNVTGNTYYYDSEKYESSDESYEETETAYYAYTADGYSYVSKSTATGEEDSWYGYQSTSTYVSAYFNIGYYMTEFADSYADFEYSDADGAYKATDEGQEIYIKINDGHLTSLVMKETYSYEETDYSYSYTVTYDFKFSAYGSTSVSIPAEYTYENYFATYGAN